MPSNRRTGRGSGNGYCYNPPDRLANFTGYRDYERYGRDRLDADHLRRIPEGVFDVNHDNWTQWPMIGGNYGEWDWTRLRRQRRDGG